MRHHQHHRLLLRADRGMALAAAIDAVVRPGMRVLDAGAGTGLLTVWAAKRGAEVVAADLASLDVARLMVRDNGVADRVSFVQGDLSTLTADAIGRFDVILALVYHNDPRQDERQQAIAGHLAAELAAPGAVLLPDAVRYTGRLVDWPAQDLDTRTARVDRTIAALEGAYAVSLASLRRALVEVPEPDVFPPRDGTGSVLSTDARVLGPSVELATVRYAAGAGALGAYPGSIRIPAAAGGVANVVLWTQELWCGDRLMFSNESVSWLAPAVWVRPGDVLTLPLGDRWRRTNTFTPEGP